MIKQAAPKLKDKAELGENSPWRHYTGDIRLWAGLLAIPLLLFAGAALFGHHRAAEPAASLSCDYASWVGKPLNMDQVRATKRPYEFIAKGGVIEPSGDESMINIELDKNTVLKVWCG